MPGSWLPQEHPNLTAHSCVLTSPKSNAYNCIAWAAGEITRWWWPASLRGISYWPKGVPREETLAAFIAAFATKGFAPCADGSLQEGIEKVALFAKQIGGLVIPTHAARQLESGQWTSKMGSLEDIHHSTFNDVNGPIYGQPVQFLARPRNQPPDS
jgi:hypothetical protein